MVTPLFTNRDGLRKRLSGKGPWPLQRLPFPQGRPGKQRQRLSRISNRELRAKGSCTVGPWESGRERGGKGERGKALCTESEWPKWLRGPRLGDLRRRLMASSARGPPHQEAPGMRAPRVETQVGVWQPQPGPAGLRPTRPQPPPGRAGTECAHKGGFPMRSPGEAFATGRSGRPETSLMS